MNAIAQTQPENAPRRRLLLVDGSGYIFRAYHALPPLTRRDGTPVGAVLGFMNMMMKLCDSQQADAIAVIFDAARQTFRNEIYADYKANRPPAPDDLIPQFALVREATRALKIPAVELDRYEADDLIASYARDAVEKGMEVVIVSSDKDLMQLINDHVSMLDPIKGKPIGAAEVMEKFGVTPDKVIEVQALIGDSVDNVPGIPGIGPKTAAQLIQEYGDLETLLARAGEIKQNKRRESLIEFAEQARISYELVKLKYDTPLPVPIEEMGRCDADADELLEFLQENGFKALLKRMEDRFGKVATVSQVAPPHPNPLPDGEREQGTLSPSGRGQGEGAVIIDRTKYVLVQDLATLQLWIARAQEAGSVAVDTETTSLNAMQAELVGVSLAIAPGEACYIPLGHVVESSEQGEPPHPNPLPVGEREHAAKALSPTGRGLGEGGQADLFAPPPPKIALHPGQIPLDQALLALRPLLADPGVLKIGQNIKYDMLVLAKYGLTVTPIDDTMMLSYVLAAGLHNHNMDELCERYLEHCPIAFKKVVGTGKAQVLFSQVGLDAARDYAAEDADVTLRLHNCLKPKLIEQKLVTVYERIERQLLPVIVEMEKAGITVDPNYLRGLSAEFAGEMQRLEGEIHRLAGQPFNIGSPKQLGDILFEAMQLPGGKKSGKTGAYSTDVTVLEDLAAAGHEMPGKVLEWRQLAKLKGTYTDALVGQINPKTGRIHTSFSLAVATTGRLSSSDPNLQNIPIRTEAGKRIRNAFVAAKGHKLISADYSQIELRLLADIAGIDVLKAAFKDGADIHSATASQMFGVPLADVSGDLRRKAKTINFGIIYGISAHGLATRLGIGRKEAADYIEAYFAQYPGIKAYMERTKEFAREHGYVTTQFGRRVHVKDINAKNPNLRAFSERAAINAPLQGTAADIIKRAMVSVQALLEEKYPHSKLLLQVHDELILEAPEAHAAEVGAAVQKVMQGAAHLSVPLLVEYGIGDHWGEVH